MDAPRDRPGEETRNGGAALIRGLLAAADGQVGDASLRDRFGDLGTAFAATLAPWLEPFAAAMPDLAPTVHSQAAARAISDLARLAGTFADDAAQRLAGGPPDDAARSGYEHYAELTARIDDAFRAFSSSPEFDRARRHAAAAVLAWLEHDPAVASGIVHFLESAPSPARHAEDAAPREIRLPFMDDGNATLVRHPSDQEARASVLIIPGFAAGTDIFDLDPERSVVRTLAKHGVEAWLLDWGRCDASDRELRVADQLDRIDRAIDAVREAADGRSPALAGHFHGGLLALLYCMRHPGKAGALITLSTPVDFASTDDVFGDWLRACDGERLAGMLGRLPGALTAALVAATSPMRWCVGGFYTLIDGVDCAAEAVRVARFEHARRCPPAFPGETFRGLFRAFYRDNAFMTEGGALIDGHRYDLSRLETPLLNVFARDDRVVPPAACTPLGAMAKRAPGSERTHPGGHFELLISQRAHAELLPDIADWLRERQYTAGKADQSSRF